MLLYRKILILLIFVFSIIIIYRFIQRRIEIKANHLEGFGAATKESEVAAIQKIYSSIPTGIIGLKNANLPLNQYFIKGSANSACSGTFVSTDMVNLVLSRGCRFLDFQIVSGQDTSAMSSSGTNAVAMVTAPNCGNTVLLSDVLKSIMINGMTNAPNSTDPLFVQLRVQGNSPKGDSLTIYEQISFAIQKYLAGSPYLYTPNENMRRIRSTTPLSQIMNKIVLVMDIGLAPEYSDNAQYKNPANNLAKYVAMESNTFDIQSFDYDSGLENMRTPIFQISSDSESTNITQFTVVNPSADSNYNPTDYAPFVQLHGYNVLLYQYAFSDMTSIGKYEALFGATDGTNTPSGYNRAFLPIMRVLKWLKQNSTQ